MFSRFMDQFKDPMILILVAAAVISLSVSLLNHEGIKGLFEPFLILLIVVVNAIMGVMQEDKAQKALDALRKMSAPQAKVIRDGKETLVESSELVPGDLIRLEAGDYVPADARLITSSALKSEESALTGESVPSTKEADAIIEEGAPLGDRKTMVYSGCSISYGTGTALVTATGMDTEMGRIANLLDNENETMTPLQKSSTPRQVSRHSGDRLLRDYLRCGPHGRSAASGTVHDVRIAGGIGYSRRSARHRYHCSFHWRSAHGQEERHYPQAAGGRNPRLDFGHLFR